MIEKTIEKLQAKIEFKQVAPVEIDFDTGEFTFEVEIRNRGLKDMKDFTIMSAQASVEAVFDDPVIEQGYGFSFFGTKGYTFSPVFARDHIVVRFAGHFVNEFPEDKFTIVLKKVKGEDAVPLFQTLTFRTMAKQPATHGSHLALFEMSDLSEFLSEGTWYNVVMLWCLIIAGFASLVLWLVIRKCRRIDSLKERDQLEAFSYDNGNNDKEDSVGSSVAPQDSDQQMSTTHYAVLAGNNKTPAVF